MAFRSVDSMYFVAFKRSDTIMHRVGDTVSF